MTVSSIIINIPVDPLLIIMLEEAARDEKLTDILLRLDEEKELFEITPMRGDNLPVHLTDKALTEYYKYKGL